MTRFVLSKQVKILQDAMFKELTLTGRTFDGDPNDLLALVNSALTARLQLIMQQALNSLGGFTQVPPDWFDNAFGMSPHEAAANTEAPLPHPDSDDEEYDNVVMGFSPEQIQEIAKEASERGLASVHQRLEASGPKELAATLSPPVPAADRPEPERPPFRAKPEPVEEENYIEHLKGDQPEAFGRITTWAQEKGANSRFFLLKGYAGTGKTHLLRALTRWCGNRGINYLVSAPTHKAARAIRKSTGTMARTTQATLGYKMVKEGEKLVMRRNKKAPVYIPFGSLLVVDEVSMLSEDMCQAIQDMADEFGLIVLLVGDPAQLPPVQEIRSKVWSMVRKEYQFLMTQVVRYGDSLLDVSVNIRKALRLKKPFTVASSTLNEDGTGSHLLSRKEWLKAILLPEPKDYLDSPVLVWRNSALRKYTTLIREHFGYEDAFVVGEPIMTLEPTFIGSEVCDPGNTEFTITRVESCQWENRDEVMNYWLLESPDLTKGYVKVPKKPARYEALKAKFAAAAQEKIAAGNSKGAWADYWEFVQEFTPVNHAYALTVHRAQGSTYTNVYADQSDLSAETQLRTRNSLYYVAWTRATDNVYTF